MLENCLSIQKDKKGKRAEIVSSDFSSQYCWMLRDPSRALLFSSRFPAIYNHKDSYQVTNIGK